MLVKQMRLQMYVIVSRMLDQKTSAMMCEWHTRNNKFSTKSKGAFLIVQCLLLPRPYVRTVFFCTLQAELNLWLHYRFYHDPNDGTPCAQINCDCTHICVPSWHQMWMASLLVHTDSSSAQTTVLTILQDLSYSFLNLKNELLEVSPLMWQSSQEIDMLYCCSLSLSCLSINNFSTDKSHHARMQMSCNIMKNISERGSQTGMFPDVHFCGFSSWCALCRIHCKLLGREDHLD